jgi:hydrogenase nickel incorporation protein HypA/HybF
MHEAAIAEALIAAAEAELARSGARGRIVRLELSVGRLSGVSPEALRFAYERLSPGTPVEGARLEIAEPKALCCCEKCGAQSETDDLLACCPACGGDAVAIQGGRELLLQAIELEE